MSRNILKRTTAIMLATVCFVNNFPQGINVYAVSANSETSEISENVISIENEADFIEFAKNSKYDEYTNNKTFKLTQNITLENNVLVPIFSGDFQGDGHTIEILNSDDNFMGVFRIVSESGQISNLNIVGDFKTENSNIGGIVSENSGIISNCSFSGTLSGKEVVGGIVGTNSGFIINCENNGLIFGEETVGGIVGENNGSIVKSTNNNEINTQLNIVMNNIEFSDFGNDIDLETTLLDSVLDVGGIAGTSIGIIQNCENNSDVGYVHIGYNIGGIVGKHSGLINNCRNNGNVYGRKEVGGIVGQFEPYVTSIYSENSLKKLQTELDVLGDLTSNLTDNAKNNTTILSTDIHNLNDKIQESRVHTENLIDKTEALINENIEVVNEISVTVTDVISDFANMSEDITLMDQEIIHTLDYIDKAIDRFNKEVEHLEGIEDNFISMNHYIVDTMEHLRNSQTILEELNDIDLSLNGVVDGEDLDDLIDEIVDSVDYITSELNNAIYYISYIVQYFNLGSGDWDSDFDVSFGDLSDTIQSTISLISDISEKLEDLEGNLGDGSAGENDSTGGDDTASDENSTGGDDDSQQENNSATNDDNVIDSQEQTAQDENMSDGTESSMTSTNNLFNVEFKNPFLVTVNANPRDGFSNLEGSLASLNSAFSNLKNLEQNLNSIFTLLNNSAVASLNESAYDLESDTNLIEEYLYQAQKHLQNSVYSVNYLISVFGDINFSEIQNNVVTNIESIENTFTETRTILSDVGNEMNVAGEDAISAIQELNEILEIVGGTNEGIQETIDYVSDAVENSKLIFEIAENVIEQIGDTLETASEEEKTFKIADESYKETRDLLNDSITDVFDGVSIINNSISNTTITFLDDFDEISNQLGIIVDLFIDSIEDVTNFGSSFTIDDISHYTETEVGKISESVNVGDVEGDINVGGLIGAISFELSFDHEDDYKFDAMQSVSRKGTAVVIESSNSGNVTAKKNSVGGIVGLQEFGVINNCASAGIVESVSGDYAGGIAGKSTAVINESYSKSYVTAKNYVGGIVGFGNHIQNTYSISYVLGEKNNVGGTAGSMPIDGVLNNNFFVSESLGGVDGISFKGKTQAIGYEKIQELHLDLFDNFDVIFKLEDEIIHVEKIDFNTQIINLKFPEISEKDGHYVNWEVRNEELVQSSLIFNAEYEKNITSLVSEQKDGVLANALVNGEFTQEHSLVFEDNNGEYKVLVKDGEISSVRLLKSFDNSKIEVFENGKWNKVSTDVDGLYIVFNVDEKEEVVFRESAIIIDDDFVGWFVLFGTLVVLGVARFSRKRKRDVGLSY